MSTGVALKGYLEKYVAMHNPPRPRITIDVVAFDWYNAFLQGLLDTEAYVWLARLIAVGELLIGIALVLGLLVGITASFSLFTSLNLGLSRLGADQLLLPPRLDRADLRHGKRLGTMGSIAGSCRASVACGRRTSARQHTLLHLLLRRSGSSGVLAGSAAYCLFAGLVRSIPEDAEIVSEHDWETTPVRMMAQLP